MKLPDLDPSGGPLRIHAVLLEYDGPQLFTARNPGGSLFLVLHGPPLDAGDLWLFVRTTHHRVKQVLAGDITLRAAMTTYAYGDVAVATAFDDTWDFYFIPSTQVPHEYLPDADAKLKQASQAIQDYNSLLPHYDEDIFDIPLRTYQDMWEFDQETVSFLKEHITPLFVVAKRRQRLVADIVLADNDHKHDIPLPDLSKILLSLQKTVDCLGAPELDSDWKPSKVSRQETRLSAIAAFPSSFGLRIEASEGALADQSAGALAFRRLIDLLMSAKNMDSLRDVLKFHGKATKLQFGKFVESLAASGQAVRISASTGLSENTETAMISNDSLTLVSQKIKEINETDVEEVYARGHLKAVSMRTKFFLIENDDESYSGRISDELLPKISGMRIDEVYDATIFRTYSIHDLTGEITSKMSLVHLEQVET